MEMIIITDSDQLAKLKKGALRQKLDVRRELLKEPILAKTKLKDMKNKPQMIKAILESDERRLPHPATSETDTPA
ncbi:hypothetical protein DFH09DRAFT_1312765 [Mycena vulgaris]|nr:hypothetical protein DFH09DRAFT_1312765 [Mycena vulgaris]